MKTIKPHKIIIEFTEQGIFAKGILIYQTVETSGVLNQKYKTISFNSEVNIPTMHVITNKAVKFAEKQENI